MPNVVIRDTFKALQQYLPDGVRPAIEAVFRNLPRDIQLADNLALYTADAVHTIVEISDNVGAYPVIMAVKSNGTACVVKLYADDSSDVTVGTTSACLSLQVTATSGDFGVVAAFGNMLKQLANGSGADGLSIAAPATDVGTGAVANDPTVWVIYTTS